MAQSIVDKTKLDLLRQENYNCTKCKCRSSCKQVSVGNGAVNPKVVIISDQPPGLEGRCIYLIDSLLKELGLERSQAYMTYLQKCPGLSKKTIDICKSWLQKELELLKPDRIICMGRASANFILQKPFSRPIEPHKWIGNTYITYGGTYLLNHPGEIDLVREGIRNEIIKK